MLLEPPFLIETPKLTQYLLIPLVKHDKSNYLKLAGYLLDNWLVLKTDLLSLVATNDAVLERKTEYGITYSVLGSLTGPNGRTIQVKTIWMWDDEEEVTKLITLFPPGV